MKEQRYSNKYLSITKVKAHSLLFALLFFFTPLANAQKAVTALDTLNVKYVWYAAQFLPGSGQVINRQYWKVPVFWAGMGSMFYLGYNANSEYKRMQREFDPIFYGPEEIELHRERWKLKRIERNAFYTGATLFYVASIADALLVRTKGEHSPLTATLFSTFLPGLGQIYNKKYWKVPVVYGGIASLYYVIDYNNRGYIRFRTAYQYLTDDKEETVDEFNGSRSKDELSYLKDAFRRNRDLAAIGMFVFYAMNIIDANVDAHLFDWDISDNLAFKFEPIIDGDVMAKRKDPNPVIGFKCSLKF